MVNRYGYPIDDAAAVACDEVRKFLESEDAGKVRHLSFNPHVPIEHYS